MVPALQAPFICQLEVLPIMKQPSKHFTLRSAVIATVAAAWLQVPAAMAVPFTTDLAVTGTVTFDTAFATPGSATASPFAISGSGSQSGAMTVQSGSVGSSTNYTGFTAAGPNPRSAPLTDLTDGIQIGTATAQANGIGSFAVGIGSPTVPTQMALRVHNNSATVGYHLTFGYSIGNTVTSFGTDAFVHSAFSLSDNSAEIKFSDLTTDTVNGNVKNGIAGGNGGVVTDTQSGTFTYDVLSGGDLNLHGFWTLEGGSFELGGGAGLGGFNFNLRLTDVTPLRPTSPLPLPGTLALFVLGLAALVRTKQKRN